MNLRIALLCAAAFASGCANLRQPDPERQQAETQWAVQTEALRQLQQFSLHGRIASGGALGLSGSLHWTQHADGRFNLNLAGPFGSGAVEIRGDGQRMQVQTREGIVETADAEAWIREKTGWSLPVAGLRWWVLGLPSPHSGAQVELDAQGLPLQLSQDGWQLQYREYQAVDGLLLPRKLEANHAETRIKLVVDRWTDLGNPS